MNQSLETKGGNRRSSKKKIDQDKKKQHRTRTPQKDSGHTNNERRTRITEQLQ